MPSDRLPTDTVLLRVQGPPPQPQTLTQRLEGLAARRDLGASIGLVAWSADTGMGYVHVALSCRIALSRAAVAGLAGVAAGAAHVEVARLALMNDIAGRSTGHPAPFHYAVEMTPASGFGVELQRWYDREHLPGLADVPGCVRARRFWNHDAGPQSLACYDLLTQETLGSPAWLEVRGTDWSHRMRPRFTQTRRTMFTVLG